MINDFELYIGIYKGAGYHRAVVITWLLLCLSK